MINVNSVFSFPQILDCCPGTKYPLTDTLHGVGVAGGSMSPGCMPASPKNTLSGRRGPGMASDWENCQRAVLTYMQTSDLFIENLALVYLLFLFRVYELA